MQISGYKNRKISTYDSDSRLAYDLDMFLSNTTGEALFGVSGFANEADSPSNSRKLQFTFKSGRVFDPEDRCVYSYQKDTSINLRGTFLSNQYDYFINNSLICSKGAKDDFKIRNFFFDSDGCQITLNDLNVYAPTGTLDLEEGMNFEVFGSSGVSGGSSGNSGSGDTILFSNALTFNSGIDLVGSVLSGKIKMGSENFYFDNSSANRSYLADVEGDGTKKDLKLIAATELATRDYMLSIEFDTSFGKMTRTTLLKGIPPTNPSGVVLTLDGDGRPLNSGSSFASPDQAFEFDTQDQGEDVSGIYSVSYSAVNMESPEADNGLPYKIYLEHIEGDHSKQYSFITGVAMSGSGLGYSHLDSTVKDISFRTGDWFRGGVNPENLVAATYGTGIDDEAVGIVSFSAGHLSEMTEAHISSIRTNLYSGDGSAAGSDLMETNESSDGYSLVHHENVVDISTIIPQPTSSTAATKILATGVPILFNYSKPASDWKIFIGDPSETTDTYTEQAETGDGVAVAYHKYDGTNRDFLDIVVKAKQYVDTDPMVYKLVVSGADGFSAEQYITGTVMGTGYIYPEIGIL